MSVDHKIRIQDFYNLRILMDRQEGEFLSVKNGNLRIVKHLPKSDRTREQVKTLISSLLSRLEIGIGPITHDNVDAFIFKKIFPLHPTVCDPSALFQNGALKRVVERRLSQLQPEIEQDFNVIRCKQKLEETEKKIRRIEWKFFDPIQKISQWIGRLATGKWDNSLEKEWTILKWEKSRDEKYLAALKEALLGLKMQLGHETGMEKKGWSGSFFWRRYQNGSKIGVYKPSDQDSISAGSPHFLARLRFHLIPETNGVLLSQSGKSHIAEAGARLAANRFHQAFLAMQADGIDPPFHEEDALVPDTRIVELNFSSGPTEQGIGSFQLFLERCLPLSALGIHKISFYPAKNIGRLEGLLPQYQWLKLFHFLIFAQDDHAENTMAIQNEKGEITDLKAIDNGQSFPASVLKQGFLEKHILSMKPLNGLKHPLAKKKLLPFFKQFLERFRRDGYLDQLCHELRAFYQNPLHYPEGRVEDLAITNNRIRLLRERFALLDELFVRHDLPLKALLQFSRGDGRRAD